MLKTKIKISDIQNLTDARYFAAMNVDYLGFCCNPGSETFCSVAKIKEITEWVSGPEFVLQFQGYQSEDDILQLIDSGLGQALHFGAFATYERPFKVPIFKEWIFENITNDEYNKYDYPIIRSDKAFEEFSESELSKLQQLLTLRYGYIDFKWQIGNLISLLNSLPPCGLILRGGNEERLGVKSFEDLDEIFELLED
jgi:phosphoribosylanthranilate isomerase